MRMLYRDSCLGEGEEEGVGVRGLVGVGVELIYLNGLLMIIRKYRIS